MAKQRDPNEPLPLSRSELDVLKAVTDEKWAFWQYRPHPGPHYQVLYDRFHARRQWVANQKAIALAKRRNLIEALANEARINALLAERIGNALVVPIIAPPAMRERLSVLVFAVIVGLLITATTVYAVSR